jgi:galactokinase/mevalonate kinase-like predicted kinase
MHAALAAGDVEGAVAELDEYRECKRRIDPGSCPAAFVELSARWKRELSSWCLAGAGGGGFMLLVARDARAARVLSARIEREAPHPRARAFPFEVDPTGLRCAVL